MAERLSVYQQIELRYLIPQNLETLTRKRSADVQPQISLHVDDDVSNGPSTGPEHLKST
jgi:hypothetical protein